MLIFSFILQVNSKEHIGGSVMHVMIVRWTFRPLTMTMEWERDRSTDNNLKLVTKKHSLALPTLWQRFEFLFIVSGTRASRQLAVKDGQSVVAGRIS